MAMVRSRRVTARLPLGRLSALRRKKLCNEEPNRRRFRPVRDRAPPGASPSNQQGIHDLGRGLGDIRRVRLLLVLQAFLGAAWPAKSRKKG